jgi:hypothetical protein
MIDADRRASLAANCARWMRTASSERLPGTLLSVGESWIEMGGITHYPLWVIKPNIHS